MCGHSVICGFLICFTIFPPQESKQVSVTFGDIYLQEHAPNVTSYCYLFYEEMAKDPCKLVDQIWSWKMFIERISNIYCTAIKDNAPLLLS